MSIEPENTDREITSLSKIQPDFSRDLFLEPRSQTYLPDEFTPREDLRRQKPLLSTYYISKLLRCPRDGDYSKQMARPSREMIPSLRWLAAGQPYAEDEVTRLLQLPTEQSRCTCGQDCLLDNRHFPGQTLRRIKTGLDVSEVLYNRGWYYQGNKPTCLPWAITHAMAVGDVQIRPDILTDMLNQALPITGSNRGGLSWVKANTLLDGYANLQIFDRDQALQETAPFTLTLKPESVIPHNARIIKHYLDQQIPLIVSTGSAFMVADSSTHAVCIAGYRVTPEGYMNIQVLNSAERTMTGITVEDLSKRIIGGRTAILNML